MAPPGGTSAVTPAGSASGSALRCYSASVTWTVARRRCAVAMALGPEKGASTGSLTACWWGTWESDRAPWVVGTPGCWAGRSAAV